MAQTITFQAPSSKQPSKAFYAHYYDQPGCLVKIRGILTFVGEDGLVSAIEPADVNFLTVLGQMEMADAQRIDDLMNGGSASIACSRQEGVA
jgi:hypothetical protein